MFIENEGEAEVIETEATDDSSTSNEETNNEAEGETGAQAEGERRTETPEAKRARLKRQLEQLDKKHGFKDEAGDNKPEAQKEVGGDDRFDRLELKTEGLKERAEQDIVLDYMRYKKIDVMAALNSAAVKAELREFRERASTPSPSVRTGTQNKGVEYWARQVEQGKSNSDDPKMRKQVHEYLKKKLVD
jgi:hypothetical protein